MGRQFVAAILASMVVVSAIRAAPPPIRAAPQTKSGEDDLARVTRWVPGIDTWAEGTVVMLDVEGQKLAVRGSLLPEATTRARMIRDAEAMPRTTATASERELNQKSWETRLATAREETAPAEPSRFEFVLPERTTLMVLNGRGPRTDSDGTTIPRNSILTIVTGAPMNLEASPGADHDLDVKVQPSTPQSAPPARKRPVVVADTLGGYTRKEIAALVSLKDLHVGEYVKVGFKKGDHLKKAYAILRF
jgi:hypothetical protein